MLNQNAKNGDPKSEGRMGSGKYGQFGVSVEFPQQPLVWGAPRKSFGGPHLGGFSGEMILVGFRTQTHNAALFERKGPERKPWPRGSLSIARSNRNAFFERPQGLK